MPSDSQTACTVLLADDEDNYREFLEEALRFFGYTVESAKNGHDLQEKATRLLDSGVPTVFVVDNQMPESEGQHEQQWMGFTKVLELCDRYPGVGRRVIFLSRWGLNGLSADYLAKASEVQLAAPERWLNVHTPFSTIKARLDAVINGIDSSTAATS